MANRMSHRWPIVAYIFNNSSLNWLLKPSLGRSSPVLVEKKHLKSVSAVKYTFENLGRSGLPDSLILLSCHQENTVPITDTWQLLPVWWRHHCNQLDGQDFCRTSHAQKLHVCKEKPHSSVHLYRSRGLWHWPSKHCLPDSLFSARLFWKVCVFVLAHKCVIGFKLMRFIHLLKSCFKFT